MNEYMENEGEFRTVTLSNGVTGIIPTVASVKRACDDMGIERMPDACEQCAKCAVLQAWARAWKQSATAHRGANVILVDAVHQYAELHNAEGAALIAEGKRVTAANAQIDAMLAQANAMREFARKFVLWESDEDEIDERFDAFCKAGKAVQP